MHPNTTANTADPPSFKAPARKLAALFALEDNTVGDWDVAEMSAVFQHQWAASLEMAGWSTVREGISSPPRDWSYRDLFTAVSPPLEWLVHTKEFAKALSASSDSPLPSAIVKAIYFSSIFAALIRLGERITTLNDDALREGAQWGIDQNWIDPATRALFQQAAIHFGPKLTA